VFFLSGVGGQHKIEDFWIKFEKKKKTEDFVEGLIFFRRGGGNNI